MASQYTAEDTKSVLFGCGVLAFLIMVAVVAMCAIGAWAWVSTR